MPDPDPQQSSDEHDEGNRESRDPLSRSISLKWILGAILAYALIYNLILLFNSRG